MKSHKPTILITNDDGINSEGITLLFEALKDVGDVWVAAPEREQSAISHAISIMSPLAARSLDSRRFAVTGTPADCVWLGIRKLLPKKPDWVVSGINAGANLGSDVLYSGTVQAAAEGMIMGANGIAVSAEYRKGGCNFSTAAEFTRCLLSAFIGLKFSQPVLVNVNCPFTNQTEPAPRRFRITRLGQRRYITGVQTLKDARSREYYWAEGRIEGYLDIPNSDCEAVDKGYISLTPLQLDMTGYDFMEELNEKVKVAGYEGEPYRGDATPVPPHNYNGVR
ncbi:MAG: 5'/3'-nucleotidase SurE [Myxococcota bacterium]